MQYSTINLNMALLTNEDIGARLSILLRMKRMTRQELAYQFIPFLVQSFRGDNFLFGDFERWKKILADEHITEFDFDWSELKLFPSPEFPPAPA